MVKVGIIGAGRIGKVHTQGIITGVKNAQIKTIADPFMNDQTAAWIKSMDSSIQVTKDYKEILADEEIDAVIICSSTDTHSSISVEAIKAGKHVFCEKPIDHDIEKIKQVMEALEGSNIKYQVGFNRRFDHNFKAVKDVVAAGRIGDPHIIKITSRDPEPPSPAYVAVSGGMFLDMTIHDFDMVRYLAGCDATEVYVQSQAHDQTADQKCLGIHHPIHVKSSRSMQTACAIAGMLSPCMVAAGESSAPVARNSIRPMLPRSTRSSSSDASVTAEHPQPLPPQCTFCSG